jgi:hypothetical protein
MDATQRDAIVSPATGLIIFCSDCGGADGQPQYYNGRSWISMIKSSAVLNGTSDPNNSIGENGDFFINTLSLQLFGPKSTGSWGAGVSLIGQQGERGEQGIQGNDGAPGADGAPGNDGIDGAQGPQGDPGPPGVDGAQGLPGNDGIDGAQGPQGDPGLQGDPGPPGLLPDNGFGQNIGSMPFWDGGQWNLTSNIYNVLSYNENNDTFVGIGNQFPGHALDVIGTVNATSFIGDGSQLTNITIDGYYIADNSISYNKLVDGSVTTPAIAYGSVTTEKLADDSVTSVAIFNGSIATEDLADDSVTETKLQNNVVTNLKLA